MKIEISAYDNCVVTSLRPMDEAPKNGDIFQAFNSKRNEFVYVYYSDYIDAFVYGPGDIPAQLELVGWIPLLKMVTLMEDF